MPISFTATTYPELNEYATAFMRPKGLSLLFLVGGPGRGKSRAITDQLIDGQHVYVKAGQLTGLQLFKLLYQHRHKAIIFDDVEATLKRDDTRKLLMQACETEGKARKVGWLGTDNLFVVKEGEEQQVPQEFDCSSRVCIVSNDWGILNDKFGPLIDRGIVVFFKPSNEEIHRYVSGWLKDKQVLDFVGKHLDKIRSHSVRLYVTAKYLKKQGLDWKSALQESWTNDKPQSPPQEILKQILADPNLADRKAQADAFEKATGFKRRTFFNRLKALGENVDQQPATN